MTWSIRICNWQTFQHYRKPQPAWVKLHRRTLDKRGWRGLPSSAAKLLVDLWMLAAEADGGAKDPGSGEIHMPLLDVAWRLRLDAEIMLGDLQVLEREGFIALSRRTIEEGESSSRPEERRDRGEAEAETESSSASPKNWVASFCDAWLDRFQGIAPGGRIGRALKPLRGKHADDDILARWKTYLAATEAQFASPERFAQTFGEWDPKGAAAGNGVRAPEVRPGETTDQYVARVSRHG